MAKAKFNHLDPHQQELVKLIEQCARRHRRHEVFRDFCELAALSISNRVDLLQYDAREARYLEIVKRYEREEVECFPRMLACLVESLEGGHKDALGTIFEAMQLADHWKGQFFTLCGGPHNVNKAKSPLMCTAWRLAWSAARSDYVLAV